MKKNPTFAIFNNILLRVTGNTGFINMANFNNIDNLFTQEGPACVLVSYSAIINYFSNNALSIDEVLDKYSRWAGIDDSLSKVDKEKAVSDHYHDYCRPKGIRGFDYLADIIHNNNNIDTQQYCKIVTRNASIDPISEVEKLKLRDDLKMSDRLAMVLSPVQYQEMHAIVLGWDEVEKSYFVKDPNIARASREDILPKTKIYEYILFERA